MLFLLSSSFYLLFVEMPLDQGSGQPNQLNDMIGSLVRGLLQQVQQHQQPLGLARIRELDGVSVATQTDGTGTGAGTQDASTQTNPFVSYDRPLCVDASTQWEEMTPSSISVPQLRQSLRQSLQSYPSTSRLTSSTNSGQLPWEEHHQPPHADVRSSSRISLPSVRELERRRASSPPRSAPTTKKRAGPGRPPKAKLSGLVCRLCEEPKADMVTTPCTHFFCRQCINDWMDQWTHCPRCGACPVTVKAVEL